jgi:hypothetical protein
MVAVSDGDEADIVANDRRARRAAGLSAERG